MSEHAEAPAVSEVDSHYEPGTDQDLDAGTIWYTVILGTVITILVIYLLKAMFYKADHDEIVAKTYGVKYAELDAAHSSQLQKLQGYTWRDSVKGLATMPIDLAMEQVTREYAAGRTDPPMPPGAAPVPSAVPAADAAAVTEAGAGHSAAEAEGKGEAGQANGSEPGTGKAANPPAGETGTKR